MRKIYFLTLLFLCFISGRSQIASPQAAAPVIPQIQSNTLHGVFANLEKERIPTGFLLDAAVELVNLKKFDGSLQDSSFTSSKVVQGIYNTLIMSRLSSNAQLPKTSAQFSAEWKSAQEIDIIPLAGIFYNYAKFSEITQQSAINLGDPGTLTVSNGKLHDKYVNNVWQNPYETNRVFAIAPAVNTFNKFNFKVKLPSNLLLSNVANQIQKIEYRMANSTSKCNFYFTKL